MTDSNKSLIAILLAALCYLHVNTAISQVKDGARQPVKAVSVEEAKTLEAKLYQNTQDLLQDPQNPELLLQKGILLSASNKLQAAFEVFDNLRQSYPDHPAPYGNLASILARWGRLEEARQMLLKSDVLQGNRFQTQLSLATVNLELALAALAKANQLNPSDYATAQKLKLLEKYLADSSRVTFNRPAQEPAGTGGEVSANRIPSDMKARSNRAALIPLNNGPKKDRLILGPPLVEEPPSSAKTAAKASSEGITLITPAAVDSRKKDVLKTIEAWTNAWARRSADEYFALYGATFKPSDGLTRAAWTKRKLGYMEKSSYIQVDVTVKNVSFVGENASVELNQKYRSQQYADSGPKELTLRQEEGQWKIIEERSIR